MSPILASSGGESLSDRLLRPLHIPLPVAEVKPGAAVIEAPTKVHIDEAQLDLLRRQQSSPQATVTVVSGGTTTGGSDLSNNPGAIAGIVIGSIMGFLILLWIIRSCNNLGAPPGSRSDRQWTDDDYHSGGGRRRSRSRSRHSSRSGGHHHHHHHHDHGHGHRHSSRRRSSVRPVMVEVDTTTTPAPAYVYDRR